MFKFLLNNPFNSALSNIGRILDYEQKKRGAFMMILLLINAFIDIIGLASIFGVINTALQSTTYIDPSTSSPANISSFEVWLNALLKSLFDMTNASSHTEFLLILSVILLVVLLIKNIISTIIVYMQTKYAYDVSLQLNLKMFKYYYERGYLFLRETTSGKKIYGIIDLPFQFASSYLGPFFSFVTELLVLFIVVGLLLLIQPLAILMLFLVIVPFFFLLYGLVKDRVKHIGQRRHKMSPGNYAQVLESMKAYVDIKLGNLENVFLNKYRNSQSEVNRMDVLTQGFYQKLYQRSNDMIVGLGILGLFIFTYFRQIPNEQIVTILAFFGVAAYKFIPSINRILNALLSIKNTSYVVAELKQIGNKQLVPFPTAKDISFNGEIQLEDLVFQYSPEEPPVIQNLNLTIRKGETVGIFGPSGSGKTTLLKIMLRLIQENSGRVIMDGLHIDGPGLNASFQKKVGYVEQDVFVLDGTLKQNIAFGSDDINNDLLLYAIKDSMLEEMVSKHENGVDMALGEGGVKLSGGQVQRVGIARALYKEADILLFDEATSALDIETEQAIVESIYHLSELGKTIVIIAHRLTTLKNCDRIIEIDEGKIIGTHEYAELINKKIIRGTDVSESPQNS